MSNNVARERESDLDPRCQSGSSPGDKGAKGESARKEMDDLLLPFHRKLLEEESAIDPEVIAERGYFSVQKKARLQELGFGRTLQKVPALAIPYYNSRGEIATYQMRPDEPVVINGEPRKYLFPPKSQTVIDVHPRIRERLKDPAVPLYFTEGIRKGDSAISQGLCCVVLAGVWNWRGKNASGGKVALPDFESIPLNGRDAIIAFDSDAATNPAIAYSMQRLAAFLKRRDAKVQYLYLPAAADGSKVGLDDFFAAGGTVDDLQQYVTPHLKSVVEHSECGKYIIQNAETYYLKPVQGGAVVPEKLMNFSAVITKTIHLDDGQDTQRALELTARLQEVEKTFQLTLPEFLRMDWALAELGSAAILEPGLMVKDRARAAIQALSGKTPIEKVYTHTGWTVNDGTPFFLHAHGAIGPNGTEFGNKVALGDGCTHFCLPAPPTGEELSDSVKAALAILESFPSWLGHVLLTAPFIPIVLDPDFAIHLSGRTGTGKSELASLVQRFYGQAMDARNLPASWNSTENYLVEMAFILKNVAMGTDDFNPRGGDYEVRSWHRKADVVFRSQGNRSGRGRLRADITARPTHFPRGLIFSTGEDTPTGQSLRARMLILELSRSDFEITSLTPHQKAAGKGLYSQTLSAFIAWVAERYTEIWGEGSRDRVEELRDQAIDVLTGQRQLHLPGNDN